MAVATSVATSTMAAVMPTASAPASTIPLASTYNYVTINDPTDLTFNQLLGINTANNIAGYYGAGTTPQNPNQGYILKAPGYIGASIMPANYPQSVQTQQIGINDKGETVGFYIDAAGTMHGFYYNAANYTSVDHPSASSTQLLGINNGGYAAGFYNSTIDNFNHGFIWPVATGAIVEIAPSTTCQNVIATSTNGKGDVVGVCTTADGVTMGFVANDGNYNYTIQVPGSNNTQIFGINDGRMFVGTFADSTGATHGFSAVAAVAGAAITASNFMQIDHPNGTAGTILNGINNAGYIVGFYVDAAGNTNGALFTPGGTGQGSNLGGLAPAATTTAAVGTVPAVVATGTGVAPLATSGTKTMGAATTSASIASPTPAVVASTPVMLTSTKSGASVVVPATFAALAITFFAALAF